MKMVSTVTTENIDQGFAEQVKGNIEAVDDFLGEVATVVHKEAKTTSMFADKTGNLRNSIKKLKSKFEDGGWIVVASGKNRTSAHAHLIEFGHVKWLWGKDKSPERVPPYPFLRTALEKGIAYARTRIGGGT